MKTIKIPKYDIIAPSIIESRFIGWSYKVEVYENLFLLIKLVNYQLLPPKQRGKQTPCWYFSLCNACGQPIFYTYISTENGIEDGYRAGIAWVLQEAKNLGRRLVELPDILELAY